MRKALNVAVREFLSTVLTKGFIIGIVMTPAIMLVAIVGISVLMKNAGPKVEGTVTVIDRSGLVGSRLAEMFSPEAIKEAQEKAAAEAADMTRQATGVAPIPNAQKEMAINVAASAASAAIEKTRGLSIEVLPADADAAKAKEGLATVDIHARSHDSSAAKPRIMVAVIPDSAVRGKAGDKPHEVEFDKYELYTAPKLDFEIRQRVERKIGEAIVDARISTDERLKNSGLSVQTVRDLVQAPDADVVNVTRTGEKSGKMGEAQMLIPMAFILLLFMAVMVSGQSLLTTTIEEKSSRVMEVLLSAVSPMELMVGKILGQMGVGVLILLLYAGLGMGSLVVMSMADLIEPIKLLYLSVYFVIAYFTIASMMAAIGSAVSELREAQTLMTPVMTLMIIPWVLWLPISRAPNSLLAQILSFVPGPNPFVMVIRLCGSEPVPFWQIPASLAVGAAGAVFAAWSAAKIFRIGALMYGKPPNFRTLIKWVRMA
jgi:ABC-2 type transport system permease protein